MLKSKISLQHSDLQIMYKILNNALHLPCTGMVDVADIKETFYILKDRSTAARPEIQI